MPKFTKAYSFGLVTGLPYIVMEPTIRLLNDQRVQRGRAAQGAFTWSDFFPQFFFSTFQNWQSGSATRLAKRPGLAMFYLGFVAPGRATTDLKPRSTASYPRNRPSPVRLSGGRRSPGLRPNSQTNAQRLTARQFRGQVARLAPKTTSVNVTPGLCLHSAAHITRHIHKEEGIRNKPGIRSVAILGNALKRPTNQLEIPGTRRSVRSQRPPP